MDPTATYKLMLEEFAAANFDEAEEAANNLHNWITNGGFYPVGFEPLTVRNAIRSIQLFCELTRELA